VEEDKVVQRIQDLERVDSYYRDDSTDYVTTGINRFAECRKHSAKP
jgi:hypothetical protein